jgi:hypothetical protein
MPDNDREDAMEWKSYREEEGLFEVSFPEEWTAEADGEGGVLIFHEDGCGLLHLMPFEREVEEESDPAEELYAFLAEQEIELEEDEVEDMDLGGTGSLALCEYLAEEAGEVVYWRVGVATAPGRLVFASYSCPSEDRETERERITRILSSLRFAGGH